MSTLLLSLPAFVGWTLLLLSALLSWRGIVILRGAGRMDSFPAGERHGSDAYWRLNRAHQNCLENLPLFAAVAVVGAALGTSTLAALPVALLASKVVPVARVVQSLAHVSSGNVIAITVRFTAFFVQLIAFAVMCVSFASVLL